MKKFMLEGKLFEPEEKQNKVRDGIGKAFIKYQKSVEQMNLIPWIREELEKRSNKILVVKIPDLINEMGTGFKKYKYSTIYQALRYILFYNGFIIGTGTLKEGDKVFVIREKDKDDKLPDYYAIYEDRAERNEKRKEEFEDRAKRKEKRKEEINKIKISKIDEKLQEIKRERESLIIESQRQKEEVKVEKTILELERKELEKIIEFNELFTQKFENNIYLVEIFQFNWKTLSWKLIKRKSIKNHLELFDLIIKFTSAVDNRFRFEITPIQEKEAENEKEIGD